MISIAQLELAPKGLDPYDRTPVKPSPVHASDDLESPSYLIERLLDRRVRTVKGKQKIEYLVKWEGYGLKYNVYYDLNDL